MARVVQVRGESDNAWRRLDFGLAHTIACDQEQNQESPGSVPL